MIIGKISPGLANSMLEYATVYSLAKELNEELYLDLSEFGTSTWPFLLDVFDIPKFKKINYFNGLYGHEDRNGIAKSLMRDAVILVEREAMEDDEYRLQDIESEEIKNFVKTKNLITCGYFMNYEYRRKYHKEVMGQFRIKGDYEEIKQFEKMISNCVSVGVHIRRGDMLYADWAVKMSDDYYRAAIAYARKKWKNCQFFIFSDDKVYVQKLLGYAEDIHYINFLGFSEADVMEFVCLSKCSHRIISSSSTFSLFADEMNGQDGRYMIRFFEDTRHIKVGLYRFVNRYFPSMLSDACGAKVIGMDKRKIHKWVSQYFCTDKKLTKVYSMNIPDESWTKEIAHEVLKRLAVIENDAYGISNTQAYEMLEYKARALHLLGEKARFLDLAYPLYAVCCDKVWFRDAYTQTLSELGYGEEAAMESMRNIRNSDKVFVVAPEEEQSGIYSRSDYYMQIAEILGHLGYTVFLITNDRGRTSEVYINQSKGGYFVNAGGIKYMYYILRDCDNWREDIVFALNGIEKYSFYHIGDLLDCIWKGKQLFIEKMNPRDTVMYDNERVTWDKMHRMNPEVIRRLQEMIRENNV